MKTLKMMVMMAVLTTVAMAAGGCVSVYDVSNRAAYDNYYATSQAGAAKYTFDVPYRQIKLGQLRCDSTLTVEALKEVYGADIAFVHATGVYGLDVKDLTEVGFAWLPNGYKTAYATVADFSENGKTQELKGVYHFKLPWSYDAVKVREICYGAALDLAKQIKALTDADTAKK